MNDQKTSGKNLTKRELEGLLDAGLAALRADSLDSATVSEAAARVQHQLGIESAPTQNEWQGCEDLRALIPLYLGKMSGEQLSPARVLLLEDHLGECVVCRRALREARGVRGSGQPSRPLPSPKRDRWQTIRGGGLRWSPPVRWAVAALLVGSLGLIGWTWWQRFVSPFGRLNPTVEAASGEP